MQKQFIAVLFVLGMLASNALAQSEPTESDEATHAELRALREALTEAVSSGDVDTQLKFADENIVTTWQNGQVAQGVDGVREFLQQMNGTGERVFQGYKVPPTPDDLTRVYGGDTAIAYGTSVPHYKYLGMEFDLPNRWTATLVKNDGQWKLAAYHVSSNIIDNPVLDIAKKSTYLAGGLGLLLGAVVGSLLTVLVRRKRT